MSAQSIIALLIESSARTEQCNFIGGNSNAFAISLLALQTLQLPGDMDLKNNLCPTQPDAEGCEDELE